MKKNKTFQIPATLEGTTPLKDGGMSLRFHTQELTDEEKLVIINLFQTFGYILFCANQFNDSDIPKDDASDNTKKPSQRLRAIMYVFWKQQGMKGEFEQFYNKKMEYIIGQFRDKLEPDIK